MINRMSCYLFSILIIIVDVYAVKNEYVNEFILCITLRVIISLSYLRFCSKIIWYERKNLQLLMMLCLPRWRDIVAFETTNPSSVYLVDIALTKEVTPTHRSAKNTVLLIFLTAFCSVGWREDDIRYCTCWRNRSIYRLFFLILQTGAVLTD